MSFRIPKKRFKWYTFIPMRTFIFFTLFIGHLFSTSVDFNEEGFLDFEEKPLFVSLGSHCEIADTLRKEGLRKAAFPFDWLDCRDQDSLIRILDTDFEGFTDRANFIPLPDCPVPNTVYNARYKIRFHHDWPFSDNFSDPERLEQQLQFIKTKYERRIDRFRQLRFYPGKVLFVRAFFWEIGEDVGPNYNQAVELKKALDRYFPSLNFLLIVINYTDANAPKISGIEGVHEFKIYRGAYERELGNAYQFFLY
jgi:hypothetical protein